MEAREYWNHYVAENGGPVGVSKKLGIPYQSIACICNGHRGIGHGLAQRMAKADPMLDPKKLVWVRAEKRGGGGLRQRPAATEDGDAASAASDSVPNLKDVA